MTLVRRRVRWALQHGMVGLAVRRAARTGDLQALSVVDPAHRADPYPLYEQVRTRGRLVRGKLGHVTATHAVAVDDAVRGFSDWLGGHLERLRREPGDDLLSQLVLLEDDGERLDDTELRATAGLLLAAGFETTVNLLGSGTELLLRHPEQRAVLQAEPQLWGNAVEEVLRVESPVQLTARFAVRDTTVTGLPVRQGGLLVTMLGGANRDPAVFADPGRFDVARTNAREHLAFSGGRHFCLGAALARLEGEVGLRRLFERFPDLALAGPGRRRPTRVLRGWESLPVRTGRG